MLGILVAILLLLRVSTGSSGDARAQFQHCVQACVQSGCIPASTHYDLSATEVCSQVCTSSSHNRSAGPNSDHASQFLRTWRWDCSSDCKYMCMWQMESRKESIQAANGNIRKSRVEKYYGKWPFKRAYGMQEVASVLFSSGNLAAALCSWLALVRQFQRDARNGSDGPRSPAGRGGMAAKHASREARDKGAAWVCRRLWIAQFLLAAHAWLASAIFHGRDTQFTERWDYYAAGGTVAFNTFLTMVRTLGVISFGRQLVLGMTVGCGFLWHLYHMHFTRFDYGFHVTLCIAAGFLQAILWVSWALLRAPASHKGRPWLLSFVFLMHASLVFEVYDFPPIWNYVDSHAMWHLCTIPLAYAWFRFVSYDCQLPRNIPSCKAAN